MYSLKPLPFTLLLSIATSLTTALSSTARVTGTKSITGSKSTTHLHVSSTKSTTRQHTSLATTLVTSTKSFAPLPSTSIIPESRIVNISQVWVPTNITDAAPAAINNVSIIVPPPLNPDDDNDHPYVQSVNDSLPHLLAQLGVDPNDIPALVAEAIPLFKDAVIDSLNGSTTNTTSSGINGTVTRRDLLEMDLYRRGLFSSIGNWVKKVVNGAVHVVETVAVDTGCSVFAAGAVPGYLVSADLFRIENLFKSTHATSQDQDFYIFPLHGPVSHQDSISVIYSANFPPGFGSADGVTMGRRIYLRPGIAENAGDAGFKVETKILLHEFTHIKQYQALGYSLPAFGLKYLFEYCKAGFSYTKDSLEVAAYAEQELMNALLTDPIGSDFITAWKRRGLQNSLGLPTARTFKNLGGNRYALDFQKGTLTITCAGAVCT